MSLPGITPNIGLIATVLKSLQHIGSTTSSGETIAWPSGTRSGDIAILVDNAMTLGSTAPSNVVPSGMTSMNSSSDNVTGTIPNAYAVRRTISRKILTTTETGSLTGMAATDRNRKTLTVLRPNWLVTSITHIGTSFTLSTGNPSERSVSIGVNTAPLISIGSKFTDNSGTLTMTTGTGSIDLEVLGGSVTYDTKFKFMLNLGEEQTIGWDVGDDGAWKSVAATLIKLV